MIVTDFEVFLWVGVFNKTIVPLALVEYESYSQLGTMRLVGALSTQPRPQANSRYPSNRRRLGTERDSEKAWHKMAKKSQFNEKKSQILIDENLLFSAKIREYFGCIS